MRRIQIVSKISYRNTSTSALKALATVTVWSKFQTLDWHQMNSK